MRVKSRKPPAEYLITSDCVTPSRSDAVLEMLQRFSEDLSALQRAIRWDKGDELETLFRRTRDIRRSIIEQGQDDAAPDFGRRHD